MGTGMIGCKVWGAPSMQLLWAWLWVVMLGLDTASLIGQHCHTADGPMWLCFTV